MIEKLLRADPQVLIVIGVAAALSGCTITPWDTTPEPYNSASRSYQTNGATASPVAAGFYRVNPGDTLPGIAAAFGQHPQDVARWNGLPPGASVTVGEVLRVAPPVAAAMAPPLAPGAGAVALQGTLTWPLRGPILRTFAPGSSRAS